MLQLSGEQYGSYTAVLCVCCCVVEGKLADSSAAYMQLCVSEFKAYLENKART